MAQVKIQFSKWHSLNKTILFDPEVQSKTPEFDLKTASSETMKLNRFSCLNTLFDPWGLKQFETGKSADYLSVCSSYLR